ncbi:MAG: CopG family transcriptional regulator [Moorea sp. SIO3I7]|uniref:CopG family transcriptional regulator n=1 Tax=unclassified Moorena TaxID=2683338 RepID=UPI0013BFEDD2|nr:MULTISPECIES: CopG family transcriptional regulator [unclassified Moorena]NEN94738.1 CopG family transcriptional regulator [Moorena sp. SIO3I7]NEO09121.1 CopG family transcriptional regulator [Moorena sp. SIO3I8]NEP23473.1 CopG family transcriptional regulator [Moorena sp. SIO3I6]
MKEVSIIPKREWEALDAYCKIANLNKTELFREFVRSLLTYQPPTPDSDEDSSSGES